MPCLITGVGGFLPGNPITNFALEKKLNTSDEWISSRTGIAQRFFSDVSALEMARHASLEAISHAKIDKNSIDLVLVSTCTPDGAFPSISSSLAGALEIKDCPSLDINAVCSGFVYGMHFGSAMISSGKSKRMLLVATERMSSLLSMEDRSTDVLFGDGAAAVIIEKSENALFESLVGTNGELSSILKTLEDKNRQIIKMNGGEVYKYAVQKMQESSEAVLESKNLKMEDVDFFIPHQANARIIESVGNKMNIPEKKLVLTVRDHANTSSASIPLALNYLKEKNMFSKKTILTCAVGAGMTYGAAIFQTK
ncbi:MAG: beta-ketoacyl-ACP synthase 3 [Rickettsiaceae bacterium]|nr:beta-ketoacyl-ACP synthase 3 [Rickettsiaceae bacterium]